MKKTTKAKKPAQTQKQWVPGSRATYGLLLAGWLLALVLGTVAVYYRVHGLDTEEVYHTYPLKVWQQGEIVSSDSIAFRVNSLRTDTVQVPGYWELPDGGQFVVLSLTVTNKTDAPYILSPITTMHLKDQAGTQYQVSSAPSITQAFGGELPAGQSVTGEVGFITQKGATSLQLFYDPRTSGDQTIITNLKL